MRGGYKPEFGDTTRYLFLDNGDGDPGCQCRIDVAAGGSGNVDDAGGSLEYCETLRLGGYDDWRLPTQKEIATLLDLSYKDSTWFLRIFPNVITQASRIFMRPPRRSGQPLDGEWFPSSAITFIMRIKKKWTLPLPSGAEDQTR